MSRERAIFESIDIIAERVRRVGGMTIRCISHIGQLQTIKDGNGHIAKMIRAAIEICDNKRDSATSNLLQDIHKKTERRKWFLYEVMRDLRILNNWW